MNKKDLIQYIKKTKQFVKAFDDYMAYIFLICSTLLIPVGIVMMCNYFKFHSGWGILFGSFLYLILGFFLSIFIYKRLKENITFECISPNSKIDLDDISNRIRENFRVNKIDANKDLGIIEVFTKISFFSWGEKITLVLDGNTLLINSIHYGSTNLPFTIMNDKRNIKKLKQLLL